MAQHRKESFERGFSPVREFNEFYSEITSLWHGIAKANLCRCMKIQEFNTDLMPVKFSH